MTAPVTLQRIGRVGARATDVAADYQADCQESSPSVEALLCFQVTFS